MLLFARDISCDHHMKRITLFLLSLLVLSLPSHAALPQVELLTSHGRIVLELNTDKAPQTVANFLQYVREGHYNGTVFHRVIDNFMIQGGGFTTDMQQKPTRAPIKNEASNGLKNVTYSVAMARTADPHSATAQFYINVKNNEFLDYRAPNAQSYGYCVFGKVVSGQEVVDKIKSFKTGERLQHRDVPLSPIVIESARELANKP